MGSYPETFLQEAYEQILNTLSASPEGLNLLKDLNQSSADYIGTMATLVAKGKTDGQQEYHCLKETYTKVKDFLAKQGKATLSEERSFIEGLAGIVVKEAMKRR